MWSERAAGGRLRRSGRVGGGPDRVLDKLSVDAEADALDMLLTLRRSLRCAYGDDGVRLEPGNCDDGLVLKAEEGVGAKLSFGE